jgi:hypothetical protein
VDGLESFALIVAMRMELWKRDEIMKRLDGKLSKVFIIFSLGWRSPLPNDRELGSKFKHHKKEERMPLYSIHITKDVSPPL